MFFLYPASHKATPKRGFTILELLGVVAIVGLLIGGITSSFSSFQKRQELLASVDVVARVLDDARSLTLASQNAQRYGVHVDSTQVVLFVGSVYNPSDATNEVITLPSRVQATALLEGGGDDIIFDRLTGATAQYGTTTLSLISDNTQSRDIVIQPTGIVAVQ